MSDADAATVLGRIVDAGTLCLTRPASLDRQAVDELEALQDVAAAMVTCVEGMLVAPYDVVAAQVIVACARMRAIGETQEAEHWAQVIGVMLPMVRRHWVAAIEHRRNTRPTP